MKYLSVLVLFSLPMLAAAGDLMVFKLVIRDHLFFPSRLEVPAQIKFKLVIENQDDTAEEFDSFDLNREKVIFPKKQSTIYVGPLHPGNYDYFGEYNINTARGSIIAVHEYTPESNNEAARFRGESSNAD